MEALMLHWRYPQCHFARLHLGLKHSGAIEPIQFSVKQTNLQVGIACKMCCGLFKHPAGGLPIVQ
jgi:hypothetical protein